MTLDDAIEAYTEKGDMQVVGWLTELRDIRVAQIARGVRGLESCMNPVPDKWEPPFLHRVVWTQEEETE